MDIVEFIEKGLNYKLLEYQKELLYKVAKYPDKCMIRLEPLSKTNMCRIMAVEKTEPKGNFVEFIFTDEREHENRKEEKNE